MPRGRPLTALTVASADRETLSRWARRPKTAQALARRARIVLAAAEGRSNEAIAAELAVTAHTVGKWRRRFAEQGPDGLLDEPRPGAPRTIGGADVERVIALTLESTPRDATHWSTRSMAAATGFSQSSISRIWRAFGLQPHRSESTWPPVGTFSWPRTHLLRPRLGSFGRIRLADLRSSNVIACGNVAALDSGRLTG